MYFALKISSIYFNYYARDVLIVRTDCVKDLDVISDSKQYIYRHIDCIRCQCFKVLGLVRSITCNFSSLYRLIVPLI
jgi:hypothetical protein